MDHNVDPNAENLNFAISAQALTNSAGWSFSGNGQEEFEAFPELGECCTDSGATIKFGDNDMGYINVTVYDSTENKRVPVELPDDAPCNKIIAVLVQKLKLPANGPDGAPLSYKFHHKNSGRQVAGHADSRRGRRAGWRHPSPAAGDHRRLIDDDRDQSRRFRFTGRPLQPASAHSRGGTRRRFALPACWSSEPALSATRS